MIVSGFKRLLIGPDRGLRMLWRAVIFFALAFWVLPLVLDPAFAFVADRLHLAAGLTAANVALNEFENFVVALICTAIFARYERRRVDSYGLPVARAFGAHTGEGALAGIVMAGGVPPTLDLLGSMRSEEPTSELQLPLQIGCLTTHVTKTSSFMLAFST